MQPNQSNGIEGASMGAPLALVKADVKLAAYALGRLVPQLGRSPNFSERPVLVIPVVQNKS